MNNILTYHPMQVRVLDDQFTGNFQLHFITLQNQNQTYRELIQTYRLSSWAPTALNASGLHPLRNRALATGDLPHLSPRHHPYENTRAALVQSDTVATDSLVHFTQLRKQSWSAGDQEDDVSGLPKTTRCATWRGNPARMTPRA